MTDKKQLRKELVTKRKKMTDEEFSKKSLRICNRLLNNSQYLKSKVIYCYYSVNELMQAMDIFILPSRFEGLPIVAIEAQVSGLKVIISDRISKETALSERCKFLSISESADKWAEAILSNIYYDRDSLNLSECKYCFDVVQQNNAIKEIFNLFNPFIYFNKITTCTYHQYHSFGILPMQCLCYINYEF